MWGYSRDEIMALDIKAMAWISRSDFEVWNRQWRFRDRLRVRMRFWRQETLRVFALMGRHGYIP